MSRLVWRYDVVTQELVGNGVEVADDYTLRDNETFITPPDGLLEPITFDGTTWLGASFDDWICNQNKVVQTPTVEQAMINQLGLKYAELSAKVDKLEGGAVNG